MLIVDDNKREREGIAQIIDWNKYGIDIVKLCANGAQALEYMKNNPVDIVMSDVEMPVMDGITLLKNMRDNKNSAKFIFMSCYDEFKFVKSAMDLGANGYILKPVEIEELQNLIEKVMNLKRKDIQNEERERQFRALIERNSEILTENFFRQILFDGKDDVSDSVDAELLNIPENYKFSRVILIKLNIDEQKSAGMMYISDIMEMISTLPTDGFYAKPVIVGRNQIAVVLLYVEEQRAYVMDLCIKIKEYISSKLHIDTSFGVSNEADDSISALNTLYSQAEEAVDTTFFSGYDRIILYDEIEDNGDLKFKSIDVVQLQKDVNTVLSSDDVKAARDMVERYLGKVNMNSNKNYVRYFSYMLINIIENSLINSNINTDSIISYSEIWSKVARFETIFDINQWFENVFKCVFETIDASRSSKRQSLVNDIKNIIHSEYGTHITINYIAEKLHFSGVHLNNMFKKETGQAIFDYLVSYRMGMAKQLLIEPGSKVYAVAKTVGYTNQTHFKMLFMQHVGMTPMDYKEMYGQK